MGKSRCFSVLDLSTYKNPAFLPIYYMAGSACGQDGANPVFLLANRAGKMGFPALFPQERNSLV